MTPLVFKTSEPANPAGGFDSHPPPPLVRPTSDISYCWDLATIDKVSETRWQIHTYC